ncbi:MAG: hypothetical protein QOJ65_683, partial [Fimbriimonadaceae bacterium]|nr:hypothetical protein [Fimbriimonadaceae bacterium]
MIATWLGVTAFVIGAFTFRSGMDAGAETKNPWGFHQESPKRADKLVLSDAEWRDRLT